MSVLNLDFSIYKKDIVEAYIEIFGEEYREFLEQRADKIMTLVYLQDRDVSDYFFSQIDCKRKELGVKFLNQIGFNIDSQNIDYTIELPKEANDILGEFLGPFVYWFNTYREPYLMNIEYDNIPINIINKLKSSNTPNVTIDNYKDFKTSEEYQKIVDKIKYFKSVYQELLKEMKDYQGKEQADYLDFFETENLRTQEISNEFILYAYKKFEKYLPREIIDRLNALYSDDNEKAYAIIGLLKGKNDIEYFSLNDEKELEKINFENPDDEIRYIYIERLSYFKKLGINIEKIPNSLEELHKMYQTLIARDDVKKIIPSFDLVKTYEKCKEQAIDFTERKTVFTSKSVEKAREKYGEDFTGLNLATLFNFTKAKTVTSEYKNNINGKNQILITISPSEKSSGVLDYVYLHEFCHALEEDLEHNEGCGFEDWSEKYKLASNPYLLNKRFFETINETVTDIFAIKAKEILHKKGIYMANENYLKSNLNSLNTNVILKNMLMPFINNYYSEIKQFRLYHDKKPLFDAIGEDNFLELNDIINLTSYLISATSDNYEELMQSENIQEQFQRLNALYEKITKMNSEGSMSI